MHLLNSNRSRLSARSRRTRRARRARRARRLCGELRCKSQSPQSRRERRGGAEKLLFTIACILLAAALSSPRAKQKRTEPVTNAIPSPRFVLGFNPGDDRTVADWKQITDYFARLDKASDRVQVQTIGQSTLGRTMIAAFISAPE